MKDQRAIKALEMAAQGIATPQKFVILAEEAAAAFCDHYCRFPREYDEDLHGVPLAESHICLNCPINGGEIGGKA